MNPVVEQYFSFVKLPINSSFVSVTKNITQKDPHREFLSCGRAKLK